MTGNPYPLPPALPPQPQSPAAPPTRSAADAAPGVIAIVAGGLILATELGRIVIFAALVQLRNYPALDALAVVVNIIESLLAIVAIVFAAIGLARKGSRKSLPGIGMGIGVATLWGILVSAGLYPLINAAIGR